MTPVGPLLDDLIQGRWVLTLEGDEVVAYRPPGWTGPGDPHERIARPLTRGHARHVDASAEGEGLMDGYTAWSLPWICWWVWCCPTHGWVERRSHVDVPPPRPPQD
ncbi:hypothetical protein [Nocardiopsis synnemataformans]|uniref:hypothetical protein n=1 Tax=Nocardiopsis synnemataformans TaxID=61305 RepID=UPI003EBC0146